MIHLLLALAAPLAPFPCPLAAGTRSDELATLRELWSRPLGPAYSRVAAAEGVVVTQSSDDENDFVVAFDAKDGTPRWSRPIGPVYRGHDGSEDGPISTPVIGANAVFALGPRGALRALELATGEERWTVHLVDDLGATAPDYGFTTSPTLVGGLLVVQAGGSEGRNLCAFDAATGELRWSTGDGEAAYQSPALLELLGRPMLVVLNGSELLGVAPEDGSVLWRHAFEGRDRAAMGRAGAIDGARFHAFVSGRLAVFELSETDAGYALAERLRTRELGGSYAQPVALDGHLYGFGSTFLTCVDLETGRRVWKSRPPGGRGLVAVGDRLVVFGAEGRMVVVRPTPEGYVEESGVQAFEHSGYAWPTFEGGRVFARNAEELVCLTVERATAGAGARVDVAGERLASEAALRARLAELHASGGLQTFLEETELPIVEGDRVSFVYVGEAEDVAIVGSMTGDVRAEPLERLEGTDVFLRTFAIEPGARFEYSLQVDFGEPVPDPRNPRTCETPFGRASEVVTPGYELPAHVAAPTGPAGRVETLEYTSEMLGNTRELSIYLPAGYDEGTEPLPLLLLHDGPHWIRLGGLPRALDHLIASGRVPPLVAVAIAPLDRWWFESGGSRTEEYLAMLATELVPYLGERYRLTDDPAQRALTGVRGFGLTSAFGVVAHPDVFGRAGAQSPFLGDVARHAFFEELAADAPETARFYVDWNRYEEVDPDLGVDFGADARALRSALETAGCDVSGGEVLDCHGWKSWSARLDAMLVALFGG